MNVISFSLYGDNPDFNVGMIKNVKLADKFYPGWKVFVFYDGSVPLSTLSQLRKLEAVVLIDVSSRSGSMPGMFWRFLIHDFDDIDRYVIRDADSRLGDRERSAVNEWIDSGTSLHIMRDHPHHRFLILGGMWGMKKKPFCMEDKIVKFLEGQEFNKESRNFDQSFLQHEIYPLFISDMLIHSSVSPMSDDEKIKPFPTALVDCRFVGEQYHGNGERKDGYRLLLGEDKL
jgi:hypothetical protein